MGRAPCCDKNGLKKGPWTPEEDLKLIHYIHKYGPGNWRTVPVNAGLERCGKSCRLRWTNYLRPDIKRGRFSFEEEETIIQLHRLLGNKWSAIAARLPGRTDNEIKNYWNTHIRRRLLRMGIDPVTHTRVLDLLDLPSIISSSSNLLSQLDVSNFLGIQNLANPDLLNLVATLLSSKNENLELLLQNLERNQIPNAQMGNQIPPFQPHPVHDFPPYTNWQFHSNSLENSFSSNFSQSFVSQLPENATCQSLSNNDNQNLGFDSVISTPLSSPTQLNSTTTFRNGNSTTEDEKEIYSSSMLKFEHFELDINDFM